MRCHEEVEADNVRRVLDEEAARCVVMRRWKQTASDESASLNMACN